MLGKDAWTYDFLPLLPLSCTGFIPFFWWNLDFSNSFLVDLDRTDSRKYEISTGLETYSLFSFSCWEHEESYLQRIE